jgi:glutamate N-acetyltransferase/amino-acid N-acetyltransferase
MANGLAGRVHVGRFEKALFEICEHLTREIARSGEGVTKLITIDVAGAKSRDQAKRIGKLVVNSPLVKTAVYGADPNWGRVIMAIGKSFDPTIDPARVTVGFGDATVFKKGAPVDCDLEVLRSYLGGEEVAIKINLGIGKAAARVWGCDLTEGYIKENAYYTT